MVHLLDNEVINNFECSKKWASISNKSFVIGVEVFLVSQNTLLLRGKYWLEIGCNWVGRSCNLIAIK